MASVICTRHISKVVCCVIRTPLASAHDIQRLSLALEMFHISPQREQRWIMYHITVAERCSYHAYWSITSSIIALPYLRHQKEREPREGREGLCLLAPSLLSLGA